MIIPNSFFRFSNKHAIGIQTTISRDIRTGAFCIRMFMQTTFGPKDVIRSHDTFGCAAIGVLTVLVISEMKATY